MLQPLDLVFPECYLNQHTHWMGAGVGHCIPKCVNSPPPATAPEEGGETAFPSSNGWIHPEVCVGEGGLGGEEGMGHLDTSRGGEGWHPAGEERGKCGDVCTFRGGG